MKKHVFISIILTAFLGIVTAYGQDWSQQLKEAQKLHMKYQFDKAIGICNKILAQRPDSTLATEADSLYNMEIHKLAIASENGRNMLQFASTPQLMGKQKYPAANFFLHYPGFENGTWVTTPAEFTTEATDNPFNAMHMSKNGNTIVFSAKDESGAWNIMLSKRLNDTLWSAPQILNENITTMGNEILPHLSPDGKTLYFASNGHYGMGGYDLYMSKWNDEMGDWDTAQNLGFPFSSTGNDYLYYNTPCGMFTVFSSDRETAGNEVTIYITRHEVLPLKMEITQDEAPKYATLSANAALPGTPATQETPQQGEQKEFAAYRKAESELRNLQLLLADATKELDKSREEYILADSIKRISIESKILEQERGILSITEKTTTSTARLQEIELELLAQGLFIPQQTESQTPAAAQPGANSHQATIAFANNRMGTLPHLTFEKPEPQIDLSFKVADQSVITNLSELPDGLVYHIQLITTLKRATAKNFKGITPIFERRVGSGKYTYSAGVFHTYAEALKNLNTVKRKGFTSAMITAYNKGKSITTKAARALEKQDNSIYRVTIAGYDTLPPEAVEAIRSNTSKDIAKVAVDGVMKYVIGPFGNKIEAEALSNSLKARGVSGVEVQKLENK